jgi:hypothetical protein
MPLIRDRLLHYRPAYEPQRPGGPETGFESTALDRPECEGLVFKVIRKPLLTGMTY